MIRKTKFITLLISVSLLVTAISGCDTGQKGEAPQSSSQSSVNDNVYPLKTDVKLTYWVEFLNQSSSGVTNFSQLPFFQELEKRTGVKLEFIHPSSPEQFNLMLASQEYPDIIESNFYNFPGGPEKAIADGYIIKLNDVINKYAPNLKKYYTEHPDVDKMVKTDSGSYYAFPFIRGDKTLMVFAGPIVRKDWLDDLGLKIPETIDEWYNTLVQFKLKKNCSAPLSFTYSGGTLYNTAAFIGAFGVRQGLYVEDGKVKFGEMEPGFKDFLATFRKWYEEGLLDKSIATVDQKILDANILDGKTGATIGNTGGGIGRWTKAVSSKDPKFKLAPAPYPTLKRGDVIKFGQWDLAYQPYGSASISTQCKDVEIAARFLDYGYSEQGRMLYNFGIEGVSYKMENGYPKYTELITNNKDGKSMADMIATYCRPNGAGPYIQDPRYMEQYAALPEQKDSLKIWSATKAESTILPRITLTPDESAEAARIKSDLDTYTNEMFLKFIMGVVPLDGYDSFVAQLKKIGVEKYVALYQNALERYNKR